MDAFKRNGVDTLERRMWPLCKKTGGHFWDNPHISCFSRDITEQVIHLRQVEKQNEQLKQIAWIQSHEVRSPVASILGLVQLFNKAELQDPINETVISGIEQVTMRLDDIIKKITYHTHY